MRSIFKTIAITAASMLAITGVAHANGADSETDSLLPTMDEVGSSLAAMMGDTSVNGWAAGSYNYNFEGHKNGNTATANNAVSHTTTNTFQVDQVQISLTNEATEDSRGGFNVDYEWGTVNGAGAGGALYTANVSYLAPIGTGINFDIGLVPTLIGSEVNQTNQNFNVTRGQVWAIQPVTNVGAVATMQLTDDISASLGVLNDPVGAGITDTDNEKAITGQLAWSGEDTTASFAFSWGEFGGSGLAGGNVEQGTYDVIVNYSGMEDVAMYVNYTLVSHDGGALEGERHGIAVAARKAVNEDCGIAVRGEAVISSLDAGDTETYSFTLTGDHALTGSLTAKTELRFDFSGDDTFTDKDGAISEKFAALVLAQLVYEF